MAKDTAKGIRETQRQTEEGVEPTTINVSGLLVVERVGSPVEIEIEETDDDWFS